MFDIVADRFDDVSNRYTVSRRVDLLADLASGRCLEFGGGTGQLSARLNGNNEMLHSDISPRMCAVAHRTCGCPSICCDAESVPLIEDSVDTAVSSEMIYYLNDPERFLAEAHRILRPHGQLLICVTNPWVTILERGRTLLRRLGFRRMFFDDGSPRFISLARLARLLQRAGFTVEQTRKITPLPFASLDRLNRILERSLLRHLGLFIVVVARKQPSSPPS